MQHRLISTTIALIRIVMAYCSFIRKDLIKTCNACHELCLWKEGIHQLKMCLTILTNKEHLSNITVLLYFFFFLSLLFFFNLPFFYFIIVLLIWGCLIVILFLGLFLFLISFNILLAFELFITPSMRCDPSRDFMKKIHLGSPGDNKGYIFSLDMRVSKQRRYVLISNFDLVSIICFDLYRTVFWDSKTSKFTTHHYS